MRTARPRLAAAMLAAIALFALAACGRVAVINPPREKPVELDGVYQGTVSVSLSTTTDLVREEREETGDCTKYFERSVKVRDCRRALYGWYRNPEGDLTVMLQLYEMEDVDASVQLVTDVLGGDSVGFYEGAWNSSDRTGRYALSMWVLDPDGRELEGERKDRAQQLAFAVEFWFKPRVEELTGL
ncbi:hypothetical protein Afil01_18680 [Actinorhabdospora filicis]|uniref:Lipoprotein n=1 Tax=Actinorhabdospora filicis TaxID=1785913 RepID=A0A9W6W922_9ACTN|nr:hypothetical protein [Actinorhabdospora filicis]GLZ77061.1 hypothetical protein Afil01_18680 [Actinorhabdospora filicis]